jgi:hypothetical protein
VRLPDGISGWVSFVLISRRPKSLQSKVYRWSVLGYEGILRLVSAPSIPVL